MLSQTYATFACDRAVTPPQLFAVFLFGTSTQSLPVPPFYRSVRQIHSCLADLVWYGGLSLLPTVKLLLRFPTLNSSFDCLGCPVAPLRVPAFSFGLYLMQQKLAGSRSWTRVAPKALSSTYPKRSRSNHFHNTLNSTFEGPAINSQMSCTDNRQTNSIPLPASPGL